MITLSNTVLKDIVNTLVYEDPDHQALLREAINNRKGIGVENCRSIAKWDSRYNKLITIAETHQLKYGIIERGNLWSAVFLQDSDNTVYIFFSHKNLKRVLNKNNNTHYLNLLNFFNMNFDHLQPITEQLKIEFNDDEELCSKEYLEEKALEILKFLNEEPSKVIAFAFNQSFINTVNAYMFNSKHQVVWHKNYSELIDSNYSLVLQSDNISAEKVEIMTPMSTKKQLVKLKNR